MRRASIALAGRRAAARSGGAASFAEVDLRAAKQAHVAGARESVFGPQGSLPGDRYFRKKLEGRKLMRWYFPSKYNFQDFRVDEYFEMQAERFEERPAHPSIGALQALLNEVSTQRKSLKDFFGQVDEETFLRNPSLQDLYGALRFVEPDAAISFLPPKPSIEMVTEAVFRDHMPLTGPSPPFRIEGEAQPAEAAQEFDEGIVSLYLAVKAALPQDKRSDLEVQLSKATGAAELRQRLESKASELGLVPQLDSFTPVFQDSKDLANPSATATEEAGSAAGRQRKRLELCRVRADFGVSESQRTKEAADGRRELRQLRHGGHASVQKYLARRHRFIDPMFRRRRLKWLERQMAGKNKEKEVKYNTYYATHPDDHSEWPTNKGSVTVMFPSPYH